MPNIAAQELRTFAEDLFRSIVERHQGSLTFHPLSEDESGDIGLHLIQPDRATWLVFGGDAVVIFTEGTD
jgi:hypothetical protein